jgi:hypothetical protein
MADATSLMDSEGVGRKDKLNRFLFSSFPSSPETLCFSHFHSDEPEALARDGSPSLMLPARFHRGGLVAISCNRFVAVVAPFMDTATEALGSTSSLQVATKLFLLPKHLGCLCDLHLPTPNSSYGQAESGPPERALTSHGPVSP